MLVSSLMVETCDLFVRHRKMYLAVQQYSLHLHRLLILDYGELYQSSEEKAHTCSTTHVIGVLLTEVVNGEGSQKGPLLKL